MILITLCIITLFSAIIINAFAGNFSAVLGFTLALVHYVALQSVV